MTAQTAPLSPLPPPFAPSPPSPPRRSPAWCAALLGLGSLLCDAAQARTPKAPHAASAASSPSTAQILAPSAATVPDALPAARQAWRCGNSYSASPCGDAAPLAIGDPRTEAQRRQALDVAARDERLAAWLAAGRRDRDAAASTPRPARVASPGKACGATAARACTPKKPRPRHATSKAASGAAAKGA